jgi:monoterpene epsilon-lactone hydrolase
MSLPRGTIHLPERDIPVPSTVSPQARAVMASPPAASSEFPPLDDPGAWRAMIAVRDGAIAAMMSPRAAAAAVKVENRDLASGRVYQITPDDLDGDDERIYLDIHGGGFIFGGGELCRAMAVGTAIRMAARVWAVDYRMPPDHPSPAALDDCLAAYRALLREHSPDRIIIGGSSAGGNLATALVLRARDEGLPLPAAVVLMTPAADLTEAGDSHQTNLGLDPLITGSGRQSFLLYAAGQDLTHPYLSPLNGDFTKGFPPTILTTGTRDMLLSDTVLLHRALRRAGIEAELHVTEAGGHGGFMGMAPEDQEILDEVRRFADTHWDAAAEHPPRG